MDAISKRSRWTARILMALIILAFVPSAIMKITHHPTAMEGFGRIRIPDAAIVPIGIVELFCLALFLIPRTSVLGAFLLTGYLGGATMANIIGRTDFIHALVVGLMVWIATCLRVPELRSLLPIRRKGDAAGDPVQRRDVQRAGAADTHSPATR